MIGRTVREVVIYTENLENKSKLSHNFHDCSFVFLGSRRDEGRAGLKAMRRGNNYQLSLAQNAFLQLFHRSRHHSIIFVFFALLVAF